MLLDLDLRVGICSSCVYCWQKACTRMPFNKTGMVTKLWDGLVDCKCGKARQYVHGSFTFHCNHEVAIEWSKNPIHPKFPCLSCTVGALRGIIPEQIRRHHKPAWLVQEDHLAATPITQDGSSGHIRIKFDSLGRKRNTMHRQRQRMACDYD